MRIRTFIALDIPHQVKEAIARAQRALSPGNRDHIVWTRPEGIHLTLKFLGEVEEEKLQEVYRTMEEACEGNHPFTTRTTHSGAFPGWTSPRVLWLGVDPVLPLVDLQKEIEQRLSQVGFSPEERTFHPHLTVARVKRLHRESPLPFRFRDYPWEVYQWEVSEVKVMASELKPTGAEYRSLYRVGLLY